MPGRAGQAQTEEGLVEIDSRLLVRRGLNRKEVGVDGGEGKGQVQEKKGKTLTPSGFAPHPRASHPPEKEVSGVFKFSIIQLH